eukprot:TRINITY_DN5477_c0_g1_i2.p1 TRINITY_DN5477_c0_g1~~TRINITY_DN5477_c0_g1_i2.p1  ORF type:complete len:111 (+),score=33.52 TRINITY_DN5477_c0_g1_i2:374-706(+)
MKAMEKEIQDNPKIKQVIAVEAAAMIEAGWQSLFDKIWVFQVPTDVAISRLAVRNNMSYSDASSRISSQLSNEERAKSADIVFDTNRDASLVRKEIEDALQQLLSVSSKL